MKAEYASTINYELSLPIHEDTAHSEYAQSRAYCWEDRNWSLIVFHLMKLLVSERTVEAAA
jgi:hypothetical protein